MAGIRETCTLAHVLATEGNVSTPGAADILVVRLARVTGVWHIVQRSILPGALMSCSYLARASNPTPGNIVIQRGLYRLTDIQIGVGIGAGDVGS